VDLTEEEILRSPSLRFLRAFYQRMLDVPALERPVAIHLYYKEEGRVADFDLKNNRIQFNLRDAFLALEQLQRVLQQEEPEAAFGFFRNQLDLVLHELAHVGERPGAATHQPEDIEKGKDFRPPHWVEEEELESMVGLFGWRLRLNYARYLQGGEPGAWRNIAADLRREFPEGASDLEQIRREIMGRAEAAGLEEKSSAMLIALAEAAAAGGRGAVVLDAAELERAPGLVPVIRQFRRFADRLILLGESETAEGLATRLAKQGREIQYVPERSPDAVGAALDQIGGRGLGGVSFFGPEEAAMPARAAAEVRGLNFERPPISIEMILRGFGVDPELAAQLAAEIDQVFGLGREA
jgi:hypothetical protein